MKFTSEDLMKAMGLQVGDRVKVCHSDEVFEVINNGLFIRLHNEENEYPLYYLLNEEFDILPKPKRVGDLKCGEHDKQKCNSCPVRAICVDDYTDDTLYNKLELAHKFAKDQEIYDLLKARLDKEVVE